jgi:hypothetical protein
MTPQSSTTYPVPVHHACLRRQESLYNDGTQQCHKIQKVTGSVLYYARAVDPTVFMSLNDITPEQTKATERTQAAMNKLFDYLATHPDATIRYHASDIILHIQSDASDLSVSNTQSRLRGLFFLGPPQAKTRSNDPSSMSLPSSNTWSPPQQNQKLERDFRTPKVTPHSELHSPSWATANPGRLSAPITPPHSVS